MHVLIGFMHMTSIERMRTTLDLPEELVDEAREATGLATKTDVIVFALREVVRRKRLEQLKDMFGTTTVDIDIARSRRRPAGA
jgi:Arc/MetJ family transcription regulator